MSPSALEVEKSRLSSVRVNRRAAVRLREGHPWVYRSDLDGEPSLPRGGLVAVTDERGKFMGTALASSKSQIALRMISTGELSEAELPSLIESRLRTAFEYRRRLKIPEQSNAYRVVFSEPDQIPGLIVDRYNDVVAFQVLTQALDRPELRNVVVAILIEELHPAGIIERVETRIRELEDLPPLAGGLVYGNKSATLIEMRADRSQSPVRFHYDAAAGQKTGAFLDQRENYVAASRYAQGEALDVFCYQGGFALHLAQVCPRVTGVDSSLAALESAEKNFELNRQSLAAPEIEWIEANAFDLLRDWSDAGRRFGTIVLDPPAFAKTKRTLDTALRGYKELNLRALKMMQPSGTLVTCSCSFHVSQADFLTMLSEAASDAHRRIRLLEVRGQSLDHPVVSGIAETAYLKCVIVYVE
jgi:23S rRNA (cytosine1962-C5)-methyltransferase